jgi:hypothetical protein
MQNETQELYQYLHFDEESPSLIEKETQSIQHSESFEDKKQLEKEQQELKNKTRLNEIFKLKDEMTLQDLENIKRDLSFKKRESQKPTMYIPIVTNRDFAGILLMDLVNDPQYSHSRFLDVDIWKKKVNKSTWNGVGKGIVQNISPRRMSELYWNYDERKKWDTFYTIIDDIECLPNGNKVSRTATWIPKMFHQRDYVHVREVIETDDLSIGVYLPAEHDKVPIGLNGYIRGYVNFSGYVFRKQGNNCLCSLMTQTDISIPLPDFLIEKFISIAVKIYIRAMRKAAEQFGDKK